MIFFLGNLVQDNFFFLTNLTTYGTVLKTSVEYCDLCQTRFFFNLFQSITKLLKILSMLTMYRT